jgi:hypothetical protein
MNPKIQVNYFLNNETCYFNFTLWSSAISGYLLADSHWNLSVGLRVFLTWPMQEPKKKNTKEALADWNE